MIVQYLDRPANVTFIFNDTIAVNRLVSICFETNKQTLKKEVEMFFGKCRRNLVFHKLKRATEMMMSMIKATANRLKPIA